MLSFVLLSLLIQETLTHTATISVDNGGPWGDWGILQRCPYGTSARGVSIKVERPGPGDDTALNGIKLYCAAPGSRNEGNPITSSVGSWGQWTTTLWCPQGDKLSSFVLKVEKLQGAKDDTVANNIMMKCTDQTILTGNGDPWGEYGSWSGTCSQGICGIQTRVERPKNLGDDTALNDVIFSCCKESNV